MTSSRSARRARRSARRRPGPRTEPVPQLRTADWDATTITFGGASDAGVPGGAYLPHKCLRCQKDDHCAGAAVNCDCPCAGAAVARLRAQPRYQPPQQPPPAGYSATTGPMPALGRPAVSIGDALTRDDHWGPMLTPLPCGHCGAAPEIPDGILERTRIIGHVNWLAAQAGWKYDVDIILTCPPCQQGGAWKARQGQLEVRWPDGGICMRHDDGTGDRCDCPGAVIAVDVMLTSWDYLNTGRAISIQYAEDAKAARR